MLCRLEGIAEARAKGHSGQSQQMQIAQRQGQAHQMDKPARNEERAKVEKDRKICLQPQAIEAKALALLEH